MSGAAQATLFDGVAALDLAVGERLEVRPITQRMALAFVALHHRHHSAPRGGVHHIAVWRGDVLVGVAILGRPVARMIQTKEPRTLEVTRCCVVDHPAARHACSKLYAAARGFAKACGWSRVITYTLRDDETGASVRAAGFLRVRDAGGGEWSRANRPRKASEHAGVKVMWAWPR